MDTDISPKYLMKLVSDVEDTIWKEYTSYKNVRNYIMKWHEYDYQHHWENFEIAQKEDGNIDLNSTLHLMDGEILLKVAIDLGVDTPDFIPSIPTFKNELKADYKTANDTFSKAYKLVEEDPSTAIGMANSALESIIKEILKDKRLESKTTGNETLYKLSQIILKQFNLLNNEHPIEVKTIGSSLLSACQAIEKLRSEKTNFHGKSQDEVLISDSIYAYFIVNSVTTVGLFLKRFYSSKHPSFYEEDDDDLPF